MERATSFLPIHSTPNFHGQRAGEAVISALKLYGWHHMLQHFYCCVKGEGGLWGLPSPISFSKMLSRESLLGHNSHIATTSCTGLTFPNYSQAVSESRPGKIFTKYAELGILFVFFLIPCFRPCFLMAESWRFMLCFLKISTDLQQFSKVLDWVLVQDLMHGVSYSDLAVSCQVRPIMTVRCRAGL